MIRHVLHGLLNTALLLLLLIVGAVILVQTGPGKRLLASQLSTRLSTPEASIEITGIQGWIPIDMQIDRLELSDRSGIWLDAADLALDWSPRALLNGRIQVDTVRAKRLHVTRLPDASDEIEKPSNEPFRLPPLPNSLPPVTVTELSIQRIDLDALVLGEAASFELDGSLTAADDGRHADLTLDLQRVDQATAFLTLISNIDLDPARLTIDLDASETGGLLEQLTGQKEAGDLDLSLAGQGPFDDWSGKLGVQADGLGVAEANLSLALADQPRLGIEAIVRPTETILPAELDDLIGEGLNLELAVIQTRAQAIEIKRLDAGANHLAFASEGSIDFDSGDISLKAALDLPDLQGLSPIAKANLAGEARVALNLDGTLQEPKGIVDILGSELKADGIGIADLKTRINLATTALLNTDLAGFGIRARGSATGLAIPNTPLPDDHVAWTADVLLPLNGAVELQEVTVETAGAALQTKGTIDPDTLVSDLDIRLNTETLRRLSAPYGQNIDGTASIAATLKTTENAEAVDVDLSAILDQLTDLPEGAKELIGETVDLKAAVDFTEFRHLKVSDLTLKGTDATIRGGLGLDLQSLDLSGNVDAALPRLEALASLIKAPIEGAIDLKAKVSGNLDAPVAELALTGSDLNIADEPIDTLSLTLNGRDLVAAPEGKLQLDLTTRATPITLALDYRLDETLLALREIRLKGPKTALDGNFSIDLDKVLIDGAIKGGIDDLAALRPLLEEPLEGAITLDAKLSPDETSQNAEISINGRNISGDFGRIEALDLAAASRDLLGVATIEAKANLKALKRDDITLSTLAIQTEGDLDRLAIDLDLDGKAIQPFSLETSGALSLTGPLRLDINRLDGLFADQRFELKKPLRLEQDANSLKLAGLDFRLGSTSLTGDVDIGQQDVAGRIDLRSLPLSWLERFDGPELDGLAKADIDLGGTVDRPRIEAVVKLNDVRADKATSANLPASDVTVHADLDGGRLDTSLLATGLTQQPITATAALPIALRLQPFIFDLPEDGKIEGEAKVEVSLARVADLLALDGQIFRGNLSADLEVSGTIKTPLVDGPIKLEDGYYENIFSGTALRDIELVANASRTRLSVDQLTATAGEVQALKAEGWVDLDPEANFPLSVSLSLSQAELVNRDDAEATITGDIAMLGDLSDATIEGELFVNRAEILIPDGGGPDIPVIDVEEVGGTFINVEKREEEAEPEQPFDPELGITIDVPNKVYVRGRGLDSEWEGKLAISGPTSEPIITGNLEVRKGYFDFLEKRFEIEKGVIDFKGSSPPNPILSIEAAAIDGDFKAIVKLDGPADEPKIRLESEPALPEDEVLSRLLFNRELSEIGAVEAAKLALALNKLRGGGGFDAFGELRNALKIDTLDIVGGEEAADSRVKAGKYLNDDVYVEVEQGAGDDSSRARVEVEILPNIALEADTGADSNGGVGIKWRFDY